MSFRSVLLSDNQKKYCSYINYEPIYSLKVALKRIKSFETEFIRKNFTERVETLFDEYLRFSEIKKRNFKSNYKNKFGTKIMILLDKNRSQASCDKIVKIFMENLMGNEKLPYVAYKTRLGEGYYLQIIVLDRELQKPHYIRHDKNRYVSSKTGKWTSKNDENAVLVTKKGDYRRDNHGNRILSERFANTKSRLFHQPFELVKKLLEKSLNLAIESCQLGETEKKGVKYTREQFKYWWNKKEIAFIHRRNQMRSFIEKSLNLALDKETIYYSDYELSRDPIKLKHTDENGCWWSKKARRLKTLYFKFHQIIKSLVKTIKRDKHKTVNEVRMECELIEQKFSFELNQVLIS